MNTEVLSVPPLKKEKQLIDIYVYTDETGKKAFEVLRFEWIDKNGKKNKECRFRHREPGKDWVWKAPPTTYPFNLPAVIAAPEGQWIWIAEGEKKAKAINAAGGIATTNPFGAGPGKFKAEWLKYLEGKNVVLLPDNDDPGRAHMAAILASLEGKAHKAVIFPIPGLEPKEDVFDYFFKYGGTYPALVEMVGKWWQEKEQWAAKEVDLGDAHEPEADRLKEEAEDESFSTGWKPFPVDCLPDVMREFCTAASKALCCDPAYLAHPSLITVAACIGRKRVIRIKNTWCEPALLWGVLIAESGSMKSPAYELTKNAIREIEAELQRDNKAAGNRFKLKFKEWEASIRNSRASKAEGVEQDEPEKEPVKRFLISDITVEKLAQVNADNPKGLYLLRDEITGWVGSFGKYKEGKGAGADISDWLEIYRCGEILKDRKGGDRATVHVSRSCVSVFGGIQPKIWRKLMTEDLFDSGLVARLLPCSPPKSMKVWTEEEVDAAVLVRWVELLKSLFKMKCDFDEDNVVKPEEAVFTPKGKERWIGFFNTWGKTQSVSEGDHAAALAKLEGICARFALLLCCIELNEHVIDKLEVNETHVERAHTLTEWYLHETTRLYMSMRKPQELVMQEKVIDHVVLLGGSVTPRELYRSNPSRYGNVEAAKKMLDTLTCKELGTWERRSTTDRGGRPTMVFVMKGTSPSRAAVASGTAGPASPVPAG